MAESGCREKIPPPHPMIRPWYRSILFRLGLPGLLLLIWAWADSNHYASLLRRAGLASETGLFHWGGGMAISRVSQLSKNDAVGFSVGTRMFEPMEYPMFSRSAVPPWSFSRKALLALPDRYPGPGLRPGFWRSPSPSGATSWTVLLPHWLLILCYLATWMGGMALWQHRKVRLMKISSAPHS